MPRPRPTGNWPRYAAPTAFLAVATIAIVLVAPALHGPQVDEAPAPTPAPTETGSRLTTSTTRAKGTTARTQARRRYYTVVPGDTFGVIASKLGTTVSELERLNPGISSTSLHVGQKLRVA